MKPPWYRGTGGAAGPRPAAVQHWFSLTPLLFSSPPLLQEVFIQVGFYLGLSWLSGGEVSNQAGEGEVASPFLRKALAEVHRPAPCRRRACWPRQGIGLRRHRPRLHAWDQGGASRERGVSKSKREAAEPPCPTPSRAGRTQGNREVGSRRPRGTLASVRRAGEEMEQVLSG